MTGVNYIERGRTECWLWSLTADTAPNRDSKMACDNPVCCNPRHVVSSNKVADGPTVPPDEAEKNALRATLDKRGVKYHNFAGAAKLRELVKQTE